jgi:hypothetical protein
MFDSVMERQVLPGDLELIAPGPFLAAILSGIDRSMLNGHDLVRVMKTDARLAAHFQARMLEGMAELAYCPQSGPQADVVRNPEEVEIWPRCAVTTIGSNTKHPGNPPFNPTATTPGSAPWDTPTRHQEFHRPKKQPPALLEEGAAPEPPTGSSPSG